MAPLPVSNTPRYKVFYTNAGQQHVMDIRSSASPLAFGLNVDDFLTALGSLILATVIDDVQFAPSESSVFNTVAAGIVGNTYGSGAGSVTNKSTYLNFVGRSTGGRRVRLAVFGATGVGTDFRYIAGEDARVDAAIAALRVTANTFLTIDALRPVWKSYANAGFNAYWQRHIRP